VKIEDLPKDLLGRPNKSYLGHTSELVPTPWPYEGRRTAPGIPRRFTRRNDGRTKAEDNELKRLAKIENPGKCQGRRNQIDGWCTWPCYPGLTVCWRHGGRIQHIRAVGDKRMAEIRLMEKAGKIAARGRK
jgi:hypothetical protein